MKKFKMKKMNQKKGSVSLTLLVFAFVATVLIANQLQKQQEIRKKASISGGTATVSLEPASGNYQVDQSFDANVYFNPGGTAISAIAVRITYPYSGSGPEITATNLAVNPDLFASGDWTCPIRTIVPLGNNINIDIGCVNTNVAGFNASANTRLASFRLIINRLPATNPTILRFDSSLSAITRKSDGQDILRTPTSTGSYTVAGGGPTNTPGAPSNTPIPSPTGGLSPTPTNTPPAVTATPTATGSPGANPCSTIWGFVRDTDGRGLAGAQINITKSAVSGCWGGVCQAVVSQANGRWEAHCDGPVTCLRAVEAINPAGYQDSTTSPTGPENSEAGDVNTIFLRNPTASSCGPFTFFDRPGVAPSSTPIPTQTPTLTVTPSPTATLTPTSTPPSGNCDCQGTGQERRSQGDFNCDGTIDIVDYNEWGIKYVRAEDPIEDLSCSGGSGIQDFSVWANNYTGGSLE